MCQMCDEYENELVRMGLIEDAKKFRAERHGNDARTPDRTDKSATVAAPAKEPR